MEKESDIWSIFEELVSLIDGISKIVWDATPQIQVAIWRHLHAYLMSFFN
jgi:hypothetical protein